jgi:hypothetical protein
MNKFIISRGRPSAPGRTPPRARVLRPERAGGPDLALPSLGRAPGTTPAPPRLRIAFGAAAAGLLTALLALCLTGGLRALVLIPCVAVFMVPLAGPGAVAGAFLLVAALAPRVRRGGDPNSIRTTGLLLGSLLGLGNAILGFFILQGGTMDRVDSLWRFAAAGAVSGGVAGYRISVSLLRWRAKP